MMYLLFIEIIYMSMCILTTIIFRLIVGPGYDTQLMFLSLGWPVTLPLFLIVALGVWLYDLIDMKDDRD